MFLTITLWRNDVIIPSLEVRKLRQNRLRDFPGQSSVSSKLGFGSWRPGFCVCWSIGLSFVAHLVKVLKYYQNHLVLLTCLRALERAECLRVLDKWLDESEPVLGTGNSICFKFWLSHRFLFLSLALCAYLERQINKGIYWGFQEQPPFPWLQSLAWEFTK